MTTSHRKDLPAEYRDALASDHYVSPEFLINPEHPAAHDYLQGVQHIKRAIVATSSRMKPLNVQIVKAWHLGQKATEIADELGIQTPRVYRVVNSQNGQDLYALLQHLTHAIDGPNEAERRAMLWRMARRAEEKAPKTSIAAIAELNRMTIADYQRGTGQADNNQTVVVVNQTVLPRGALDH